MAVTVGVEPTTYSSGNCRSIQLSYVTCVKKNFPGQKKTIKSQALSPHHRPQLQKWPFPKTDHRGSISSRKGFKSNLSFVKCPVVGKSSRLPVNKTTTASCSGGDGGYAQPANFDFPEGINKPA